MMQRRSTLNLTTDKTLPPEVEKDYVHTEKDFKDRLFEAGLIQSNGVLSEGNQRRRLSGQIIATMKPTGPMSAIRAKCLDCCGGLRTEIDRCEITGCALWRYRSGHRVSTGEKKPPSEKQIVARQAAGERMKQMRGGRP